MELPANFDPLQALKKMPPAPHLGQLWHVREKSQFWHIIGLAAGNGTMPYVTYAVYPDEGDQKGPLSIENVRLDEFYMVLHDGVELIGARGVAWPSSESRSMGFAR